MQRSPNGTAPLRVALVQMHMAKDPEANLAAATGHVEAAAKKGAQIVCLPELYRSLYFPQTEDADHFRLAEPVPGPSSRAMSTLAKKHKIVLIVPLFERRAAGVYHNSALVFDSDGHQVGHYRKMHIPDDPEFYEKFYFAPGDLGFKAFQTRYGKIAVLICWDQWYPEAARLASLAGAQLLFYPTAIGSHTTVPNLVSQKQHDAWETIQRSHAIANGVFVAAANRVGREGKLQFWGQSFVCDPFGEVLAKASTAAPEVVLASCDLREIDRFRHGWPFLRDRRIDAYGALTERFLDDPA